MIGLIKGIVGEIAEDHAIVENGGIGYVIGLSLRDLSSLEIGENVKLYTEMIVREDDISLVGFLSKMDKKIFGSLRSVSGVGTRTALGMLSTLSANEIISLVINENINVITKAPGIGKKTAARIIVELRDKFMKEYEVDADMHITPSSDSQDKTNPKAKELTEALVSLGYGKSEIASVLKDLDLERDLEELIKDSFKLLMRL